MKSPAARAVVATLGFVGCLLSVLAGVLPPAITARLSTGTASAGFGLQLAGFLVCGFLISHGRARDELGAPTSSRGARLLLAFAALLTGQFLLWLPLPGTPGSDVRQWAIIASVAIAAGVAAVEFRRRPRTGLVLAAVVALYGLVVLGRLLIGQVIREAEVASPGRVRSVALGSGAAAACLAGGVAALWRARSQRSPRAAAAGAT